MVLVVCLCRHEVEVEVDIPWSSWLLWGVHEKRSCRRKEVGVGVEVEEDVDVDVDVVVKVTLPVTVRRLRISTERWEEIGA